jgi:hypothetical protein
MAETRPRLADLMKLELRTESAATVGRSEHAKRPERLAPPPGSPTKGPSLTALLALAPSGLAAAGAATPALRRPVECPHHLRRRAAAPPPLPEAKSAKGAKRTRTELEAVLDGRLTAPKLRRQLVDLANGEARFGGGLGLAAFELVRRKYLEDKYLSSFKAYVKACWLNGMPPEPISFDKVATFCLFYVASWDNSSRSLGTYVSRIKHYCAAASITYLGAEEQVKVTAFVGQLQYQFPAVIKAAVGITEKELRPLMAMLQPRALAGDRQAAQWVAMFLLAYAALLRGSEFCGGSMLVSDIQFEPPSERAGRGGMAVLVVVRKAGKKVIDERCDTVMCVTRKDRAIDPVFWMQHFLHLTRLEREEGTPAILFAERNAKGELVRQDYSYEAVTRDMRWLFGLVGVPRADELVARGFRAGAHSDLAAMGVGFETVAHLGGWKSPEAQRLYMRMKLTGFKALSEAIDGS